MLKIFAIYYLIGIVIAIILCGKNMTKAIDKGESILGTFLGLLIVAFMAPVWFIQGIFEAIKELRNERES